METSTETFVTASEEEVWRFEEDMVAGKCDGGFSDRMLAPSAEDTGSPTKARLEQVEAELAIANAELSSLKQLLSLAEAQLREVVDRSAMYVRDVQNAANKEIYTTIAHCNLLLRKLESSGGLRQLEGRRGGVAGGVEGERGVQLPSSLMGIRNAVELGLEGLENGHSLLDQLKSVEKELFLCRVRLSEAEREILKSNVEKKILEENLQISVLTALKLQDVLVMQKIVMKLEQMALRDQGIGHEGGNVPVGKDEDSIQGSQSLNQHQDSSSSLCVSKFAETQSFQKRKRQPTESLPGGLLQQKPQGPKVTQQQPQAP